MLPAHLHLQGAKGAQQSCIAKVSVRVLVLNNAISRH